jgi:hypothetical protein
MRLRQNEREVFENCDDAISALLAEFSDDLDFQKSRAKSAIWDAAKTYYEFSVGKFARIVEGVDSARTLAELDDYLSSFVRSHNMRDSAIKPIKFLAENVRVLEDVRFIHFAQDESIAEQIGAEGFKGRVTPRRMTLTRVIYDFEILGNGYIFAYPYSAKYEDTVVKSDYIVYGEADRALAFDFIPDGGESQLIVPVKCITDFEY